MMGDGLLAVTWMGQEEPVVSDWRCTTGTWFHLALVWKYGPGPLYPAEMQVLVNGRPLLSSGAQSPDVFVHTLSGSVIVGNEVKGQSGFDGWIDELRVSPVPNTPPTLRLSTIRHGTTGV